MEHFTFHQEQTENRYGTLEEEGGAGGLVTVFEEILIMVRYKCSQVEKQISP